MANKQTGRVGWTWLAVAMLLIAAPACEKQESNADDEAEAVEADESAEQAHNDEESKEGAAAKEGEKKDEEKAESTDKAKIGEPAPEFTLVDETGEEHSLSDYEGQPVVLEWTNPECPYVQRHYKAETMSTTHEELGGSDEVAWLAIDSSHSNTPENSKEWKEKHGFEHPILQDKEGNVGQSYEAKTTPHMYVIDGEGVLRYRGAIDDDPKGDKEPDARTNHVLQTVNALQEGEEIAKKQTEAYGCSVKYDG